MDRFYLTGERVYTPTEVVDEFSHCVKPENLELLVAHLCMEDLSDSIISFAEIDGFICLNIGSGDLIKITKNQKL